MEGRERGGVRKRSGAAYAMDGGEGIRRVWRGEGREGRRSREGSEGGGERLREGGCGSERYSEAIRVC